LDCFPIWDVGLQPNFTHFDRWDMQYTMLVMRYDILTEEVKFELDQLAQASQILPERVLQATNTSSSIKELFISPSLPLNPPPTPLLDPNFVWGLSFTDVLILASRTALFNTSYCMKREIVQHFD